jgi:hypothetical protein
MRHHEQKMLQERTALQMLPETQQEKEEKMRRLRNTPPGLLQTLNPVRQTAD